MNTKTTFQPRTVGLLVTALLAAGLFSACGRARPRHMVVEGKGPMVVYAARLNDGYWSDSASMEYWVTDATGLGWVYKTNEALAVGDTVRFWPCR